MIHTDRIHIRIRGQFACYTRPEYRTERMSNIVGSHAAYEGMLSQVMGHPGCRYSIERIGLLFEPRWLSVTTNEISSFATAGNPLRPVNLEAKGTRTLRTTTLLVGKKRVVHDDIWTEEDRRRGVPNHGLISTGVDYIATFRLLTPEIKYLTMTLARLRNGHYYGDHPYLGMRQFPARIDLIADLHAVDYPDVCTIVHPDGLRTVPYSAPLGHCFYGTDWDDPARPNYFTTLNVKDGVVKMPSWAAVRRQGLKREVAA